MRLVQLPVTTAVGAAPAVAGVQLQLGQVIRGVVVAQIENAILRLQTAAGTLDLEANVPLAPGTLVELTVAGTPAQPQFVVTPVRGEATAPSYQSPGNANAASGRALISVEENATSAGASADAAQAPAQVRASAAPPLNSLPTNAALSSATAIVENAATRQSGAAALYANLQAIVAQPNASVPAPVLAAARVLLGMRLDVGQSKGIDANDIKSALARSGLVAAAAPSNGSPQERQSSDLGRALTSLRQALQAWVDSEPDSAATPQTPPQAATAQSPVFRAAVSMTDQASSDGMTSQSDAASPAPSQGQTPSQGSSGQVAIARVTVSTLSQALNQSLDQAMNQGLNQAVNDLPVSETDATVPQTSLQGSPAQLSISRTAVPMPGHGLNNLLGLEPDITAPQTTTPRASVGAPSILRSVVPMPPYRDAPTVAQAPALPSISIGAPPREIALHLLDQTDGAIARQTLLQVASLPAAQTIGMPHNQPDAARLIFDIPLATAQGTAVAQIRIERDGARRGPKDIGPVWHATFSIDLEPIGPVHVRIAQTGERTAVTLKAERSESAARLSEGLPLLEAGLRDADLEPGELRCYASSPPAPPGTPGMFVDHAT